MICGSRDSHPLLPSSDACGFCPCRVLASASARAGSVCSHGVPQQTGTEHLASELLSLRQTTDSAPPSRKTKFTVEWDAKNGFLMLKLLLRHTYSEETALRSPPHLIPSFSEGGTVASFAASPSALGEGALRCLAVWLSSFVCVFVSVCVMRRVHGLFTPETQPFLEMPDKRFSV